MPRKRKLSDLSDRCRFCLTRDACTRELFTDWIRPKLEDLEKCSSIKILDKPNYPRNVCYVCLYKLEMWNQFKTQFLKTNKTIITHFKVVDQPITEANKLMKHESTADDLFSDDNKKRPKIDVSQSESLKAEIARKEGSKLVATDPVSLALAQFVEDINSDALYINNEINNIPYINKVEETNTSNQLRKKLGRPKKIEREASTKRWVERKNALLAATGYVPSESDSDTGPHLSPVQKARAKSNDKDFDKQKKLEKTTKNLEANMTDKDFDKQKKVEKPTKSLEMNAIDLDKQKKIEKALKNLETNMTDKYKVNQEDIIIDERKIRSRRIPNIEEPHPIEVKADSNKSAQIDKKLENVKVEIQRTVTEVEKVAPESNINSAAAEEIEQVEVEVDKQNESELINVEDDDTKIVTGLDGNDNNFKPQLVSSEVVVGNATYVITTVLDIADSSPSKSDISLKTNGIHIDATNQEGRKIDLLNAVQLQRVNPMEENTFIKTNGGTNNSDIQKCLKIEIEGMEVEALQRVQLELANFINQDVRKRLFDDEPELRRSELEKPSKFQNSYETLEYQLKAIIEKLLRNNYDSEVLTPLMCSNHQKISHEFVKAAALSPIFQPRVVLTRMNLGQVCKTYKVSNLHVLEAVKRRRGLVGPLSRTLGKRRHVFPKKYEGFAVSMPADPSDDDLDSKDKIKEEKEISKTKDKEKEKEKEEKKEKEQKKESKTSAVNKGNKVQQPTGTTVTVVPKISQMIVETVADDAPVMDQTPTIVDIPVTVVSEVPSARPKNVALIGPKTLCITSTTTLPSLPSINRPPILNCTPPTNKLTVTTKTAKPTIVSSTPKPLKRNRHICGICGKELFSKEEAEVHVKNHKIDAAGSAPNADGVSPVVKPKPKLMRCKRCQAIVEARHVKSHVCNSVKYNCTLCECTFGAEHLLQAHLETHAQFKVRQEAAAKASAAKAASLKEKQRVVVVQENSEVQIPQPPPEEVLDITIAENENEPQGYSCFVCDKVFVDEEQMKDHLQMHCEEVSDEGNEKGFQCAFCGEKFQSEESLEMHVGNHLHEESEEKINMMISMDSRRDKQKKSVFRCERCSESFASSLLLATHLPLHEEEDVLLAEYEKQDTEQEQDHEVEQEQLQEQEPHVCTICDEVFDTADELSDHLDIHNGNVHVCILCEKPFQSIRDLQEHVSTHL